MKTMPSLRSALAVVALLSVALQSAVADTYTVNTSSDNVVANACANHAANCSLRGAILAANAHSGDTIVFSINEFCDVSGCVLNLLSALPDISAPMSIGPTAFAIQRSSSASTQFRIFNVTTNGTVTFTGLTIKGGTLGANGGGIQNLNSGTVNVTNCVVRDNSGFSDGGGIFNNSGGAVNVINSTLSNNHAQHGGALAGVGSIVVSGSTFSGNTVVGATGAHTGDSGLAGRGGAIYIGSPGTLDVSNSTFVGNSATGGMPGGSGDAGGGNGEGGAIYYAGNNLKLASCTIVGNSTKGGTGTPAGQGLGGGIETITAATVRSSIIALNTANADADVRGSFTSGGFNLIGNAGDSTGFTAATDQTGVDPKLDTVLKNNGGPTQTVEIFPGSPAIDKGTSEGLPGNPTTDQRGSGFLRTFDDPNIVNATGGDGTDIGAFEIQTATASPTPTPIPTATPTATPSPTATPLPTATPPSQLLNLSTRKQAGAGDNVLIGGFIVAGTDDKKVILRGLGPSLPVAGALADPTLELHRADTTLLAANDNWKDTQAADVTATGIPPSNDLESAIVATLPAKPLAQGGAGYTGVLAGKGGTTGIGLLEIYDLATSANSKLANISTRGFVGTGDDLLIGGFIPGPTDRMPIKVLVRALGPSLSAQDVSGAMQDPVLELHDANGTLLVNDNWKDASNAAEIQATLPPPDDRESAIITTLPPSNSGYTAVVRGVNSSIGVALVEVFALQ